MGRRGGRREGKKDLDFDGVVRHDFAQIFYESLWIFTGQKPDVDLRSRKRWNNIDLVRAFNPGYRDGIAHVAVIAWILE